MRLDDEIWHFHKLSREAFHRGDIRMAAHHYRRLRAEHSVELYYEIELHTPTLFVHPLGSVLGRATYAPNLVVYQNVGVGSDLNGGQPVFKGPCVLFPGAKVLGGSVIGSNVYITANTVVNNRTVPDNMIVYQSTEECAGMGDRSVMRPSWRKTTRSVIADFFSLDKPTAESLDALGVGIR